MDKHSSQVWLGKLQLNFSLKQGISVLTKCQHVGPFYVKKCFYPRNDDIPHVYLLHPPGGLVGGDKLILNVQLEPNSSALLTTPGASRFYRSNGLYAEQTNMFKLRKNTTLEWVPQSSIFFPKTKAKIHNTFILEEGARVIAFETLCFGYLSSHVLLYPEETDIYLNVIISNSVGLQDRFKVTELEYFEKLGGFFISAMLFAIPSDYEILKKVRTLIKPVRSSYIGGASLLDTILIVRLLGKDHQFIKQLIHRIWYIVRPAVIGKDVTIPRIWFT
ncbi:urease accessory protein UreD [Candidatus Blochmannia ocreatus (nom. nud.)]|uniref:Urease accessory protein UreD n=1 Tax=Candidatus Blochmannia ocreatus (nom. nud.) TaxID=251538 RepID=A0ABY4SSQ2_9ENTR|nr:urease accessory protein UreD [Candidatus Blochmannia ocreatus]URJ25007.1 urease accessory protein UreD [Candidatus Blochmannia ocreatus]